MEVLKLYRENDAGMKDQGDGSSENNSDKNSSNKSLIYLDEIEDGEEESGFNIHSARLSPRSLSPPRSNRTFCHHHSLTLLCAARLLSGQQNSTKRKRRRRV